MAPRGHRLPSGCGLVFEQNVHRQQLPGAGSTAVELRADTLGNADFRNPNLNPNPNLSFIAEIRIKIKIRIKSGRTA